MGRENRQACPYTASKSADLSRKLSWNRNSRYHWRRSSGDIWPWCVRVCGLWMKIKLFCGSMACLSVCWRFISRWDLERHGIYMMSQLTTLLYFEAFDGDSPKKKNLAKMQIFTQKTEGSTLGDSQASQNKTMKFFFVYYGNLDFFWQLLPTSCIVGVWFWPMKLQQTLSLLVDLNLNPLVWSVVMQIKLQPLVWNWRESFSQPIETVERLNQLAVLWFMH